MYNREDQSLSSRPNRHPNSFQSFPELRGAMDQAWARYPRLMERASRPNAGELTFATALFAVALCDGSPNVINNAHGVVNHLLLGLSLDELHYRSLEAADYPTEVQDLILHMVNSHHRAEKGQFRSGRSKHGKPGGLAFR